MRGFKRNLPDLANPLSLIWLLHLPGPKSISDFHLYFASKHCSIHPARSENSWIPFSTNSIDCGSQWQLIQAVNQRLSTPEFHNPCNLILPPQRRSANIVQSENLLPNQQRHGTSEKNMFMGFNSISAQDTMGISGNPPFTQPVPRCQSSPYG